MPEATKVRRVVNYGEEIPAIKLYDHLSKWLCEVTVKTKNIKTHLSQYLLSLNLSGW